MAIRVTGMTIYIQHRKTRMFYDCNSGWVRSRDQATDFPSPLTDLNFAAEHILDDTEVVFFIESDFAAQSAMSHYLRAQF